MSTSDGQILMRTGCSREEPEGTGWIFIESEYESSNFIQLELDLSLFRLGPLDDFVVLTSNDTLVVVDEKHHLWMRQWTNEKGCYEILCDDDFYTSNERHLVSVNSSVLCFTNCKNQIHVFSDCLTGR